MQSKCSLPLPLAGQRLREERVDRNGGRSSRRDRNTRPCSSVTNIQQQLKRCWRCFGALARLGGHLLCAQRAGGDPRGNAAGGPRTGLDPGKQTASRSRSHLPSARASSTHHILSRVGLSATTLHRARPCGCEGCCTSRHPHWEAALPLCWQHVVVLFLELGIAAGCTTSSYGVVQGAWGRHARRLLACCPVCTFACCRARHISQEAKYRATTSPFSLCA